jgi:predicted dehydrogenase
VASPKVRIGIIGSGGIAQNAHIPGYQQIPDLCEVVAIADIDAEKGAEASRKFNVPRVVEDYRELLAMDDIDAVSICTPNYVHFQPTIDAFAAGKHVLCEKPVAMNAAEARQMVAAAKASGKKFQVGYNLRFAPSSRIAKQYADAGELGEVYWARVQALRRRGIPGWGVFIDKAKQGGGPLIDIGVHILDLTLWLMGHPKPISASGATYAKFGRRGDVVGFLGQWDYKNFTVEDFASALIRFDNGATISLESSFVANITDDVFTTTLCGTEGGAELTPFAEKAPFKLVKEKHRTLQTIAPEWPGSAVNSHYAEMKHFVESILNDTEPLVTGEQALMVAEIMDAVYASSEAGREVQIGA